MSEHYVIGGEGDAGGIIMRYLKTKFNPISVDFKLKNQNLIEKIKEDDFVYIAVPPEFHYDILLKVQHVKNIFCEKPLVWCEGETYNLPNLFCNFNSENVFKIQHVSYASRSCPAPKYLYRQKAGRGVMLDLLPHMLALYRKLDWKLVNVEVEKKEGIDVSANVQFKDSLIKVEYNGEKEFVVKGDAEEKTIDWLPEESWHRNLERFLSGDRNLEKAIKIQKIIEECYENIV